MRVKSRAEFILNMKDYNIIYRSLNVDKNGERSKAKLYLAKDGLLLVIEAEDLTALRAAINAWLRLIKMSEEIISVLEVLV